MQFTFRKTRVNNSLAQLINTKKDKATVKEVLSNPELSNSIRFELPELLNFFSYPKSISCLQIGKPTLSELPEHSTSRSSRKSVIQRPTSESKFSSDVHEKISKSFANIISTSSEDLDSPPNRIDLNGKLSQLISPAQIFKNQAELASLAFSSELNKTDKQYLDDVHGRFNRNAANILSYSSKNFHKRLCYVEPLSPFMAELIKFINTLKNGIHPAPQFYGHFSRIFEAIMRSTNGRVLQQLYNVEPSFKPFYKILLNHIHSTGIQELYAVLAIENLETFRGDDDDQMVFNQLAIKAAEFSKKVKGKKYKRITKRFVTQSEYEKLSSKFGVEEKFIDAVGSPRTRKFIQTSDSKDAHIVNSEIYIPTQIDEHEYRKRKLTRFDYYQKTSSCIMAIKSIIETSPENITRFQNSEVIDKLMETAENISENSYLMSQIYNLVLTILTTNSTNEPINIIDDFREILDKKQYFPTDKDFDKLFERKEGDTLGARVCCKAPLYFSQICTSLFEYFLRPDKSYDEFDNMFYKCFMNFLTKEQKDEILKQDDSKILKTLCQMLPKSPKNIDFIETRKGKRLVKELPPMTPEEENEMNQPPHKHKPLSGSIWEFAHALCDKKKFSPEQFPYMNGPEWTELAKQVKIYYSIVNKYISTDEEEESSDSDNDDDDEESNSDSDSDSLKNSG